MIIYMYTMANTERDYHIVFLLSIFTIVYNLLEGLLSLVYGISEETLTLTGFGLDSFIEAISGVGIMLMVIRLKQSPDTSRSLAEQTALRITGTAFYLLTAGLIAGIFINIYQRHVPDNTIPGTIISLVSIVVMIWLSAKKIALGKRLNSAPVIADGRCTQVCIWMSVILLLSSLIYELTGFIWADTLGSAGLAWYSFKEGKESFEKSHNASGCSCESDHS
jgi:divalent metal cation (Fe/Co/Zn/Cd) transporter